jgi:hypothetical protein
MEVPAIIYYADGTRTSVVLSELSYAGCRLLASEDFVIGERVTLVAMSLGAEVQAIIRWATPGEVGLRFADGGG